MVLKQDVYMKNLFSLYKLELSKIKRRDLEMWEGEDAHQEYVEALDRAKHQWDVFEQNTTTLVEVDVINRHVRSLRELASEEEQQQLAGVH